MSYSNLRVLLLVLIVVGVAVAVTVFSSIVMAIPDEAWRQADTVLVPGIATLMVIGCYWWIAYFIYDNYNY